MFEFFLSEQHLSVENVVTVPTNLPLKLLHLHIICTQFGFSEFAEVLSSVLRLYNFRSYYLFVNFI